MTKKTNWWGLLTDEEQRAVCDAYWDDKTCPFAAAVNALPARLFQPRLPEVDRLSNIIREVDGNHSLGAGLLAEAILEKLAQEGE